jgi:hypothetical protein
LIHVRVILGNISVIVLPDQLAVGKAHEAFNADGTMTNLKQRTAVEVLGANLAKILSKLQGQTLLPEQEEKWRDLMRIA